MSNTSNKKPASSKTQSSVPDILPPEVEGSEGDGLGVVGDDAVADPQPVPDFTNELVDPPASESIIDPTPVAPAAPVVDTAPPVHVRVLRNEDSVQTAAGHYTLRAGTTMLMQQSTADELVARKLVEIV